MPVRTSHKGSLAWQSLSARSGTAYKRQVHSYCLVSILQYLLLMYWSDMWLGRNDRYQKLKFNVSPKLCEVLRKFSNMEVASLLHIPERHRHFSFIHYQKRQLKDRGKPQWKSPQTATPTKRDTASKDAARSKSKHWKNSHRSVLQRWYKRCNEERSRTLLEFIWEVPWYHTAPSDDAH